MKNIYKAFILILAMASCVACAHTTSRVDKDISAYTKQLKKMQDDFSSESPDPKNKIWVQKKIDNMVQIDQYMRNFSDTPFKNSYSAAEKDEFNKKFFVFFSDLDLKNTAELKELLKIYNWFTISEFSKMTDHQAWLIVQHADQDPDFQKYILKILESLLPAKETNPSNYAYLYDRVAMSAADLSKQKPQHYGTQGRCVGPGVWEPWPIENAKLVDVRRKSVGLNSMEDYQKVFKEICH